MNAVRPGAIVTHMMMTWPRTQFYAVKLIVFKTYDPATYDMGVFGIESWQYLEFFITAVK